MAKQNTNPPQNDQKKTKQGQPTSNFPNMSSRPATNILTFPYAKRNEEDDEDLDKTINKAYKRRLLRSEIDSFDDGKSSKQGKKEEERTWILDPQTKEPVQVGEEEGQLTYAQALYHSANAQGKQGEIEKMREMVGLFNEFKGNKGKDDEPLRQFRVDENNMIQFDPESGQMTLGEARTMVDSNRRALAPKNEEEKITGKDLEIMKRDQNEYVKELVGQVMNKPSALTSDENGNITINWGANPSGPEIMAWMMSRQLEQQKQNSNNNKTMYPIDKEGHVMPIDDLLPIIRFNREQGREDKKTESMQNLVGTIRENMPTIVGVAQELLSMSKGKEEDNLAGTAWDSGNNEGITRKRESQDMNATREQLTQELINEYGLQPYECPNPSCKATIVATKNMLSAVCPSCGQQVQLQREEGPTQGNQHTEQPHKQEGSWQESGVSSEEGVSQNSSEGPSRENHKQKSSSKGRSKQKSAPQ